MAKKIQVAAAIIVDANKRVLLSQRHAQAHQGGLWEFPGGKVEMGESAEQALVRELQEELAIQLQACSLFHSEQHHYPDQEVLIHFYWVDQFAGCPRAMELQPLCWMNVAQLEQLNFPAANYRVLAKVLDRLASDT